MTRPTYLLGDIHGDYTALLEILDEPVWHGISYRYFGD